MSVRELTRTSSWHSPFSPTITQVSFPSMHYQIHPGCLSRGQVLLLPVRTCYRPGARTLPAETMTPAGLPSRWAPACQPTNITQKKKKKKVLFSHYLFLPSYHSVLRFPAGKRQKHALLGANCPLQCPPREAARAGCGPRGGSGPGPHTSRPGGGEEGDGSRRSSPSAQRGPGKVKLLPSLPRWEI